MRWGKIKSTFWTSRDVAGLSDAGRLLAVYLVSNEHANVLGAYRLPDGYITSDLGWTTQKVATTFSELAGFVLRDGDWVVVRAYLKHNEVDNVNQAKGAARCFDELPPDVQSVVATLICEFAHDAPFGEVFVSRLQAACKRLASGLVDAPYSESTEQEQEQEQEHAKPVRVSDVDLVLDHYARLGKPHGKKRPRAPDTRRTIATRLNRYTVVEICQALDNLFASTFHNGADGKGVWLGIDQVIRADARVEDFRDRSTARPASAPGDLRPLVVDDRAGEAGPTDEEREILNEELRRAGL